MTTQPSQSLNLGDMCGPYVRPSPADLNVIGAQGPDGKPMVIAIVQSVTGRQAIFLDPEQCRAWAKVLTEAADKVDTRGSLIVTDQVPQHIPSLDEFAQAARGRIRMP